MQVQEKDHRWPSRQLPAAPLKKEVAELWVKALRSGEYKMADPSGHFLATKVWSGGEEMFWSAIGVLCDIFMWETGEGEWSYKLGPEWSNIKIQDNPIFNTGWSWSAHALPKEVQDWAGLDNGTVFLKGQPVWMHEKGWISFEEIADMTEEEYINGSQS